MLLERLHPRNLNDVWDIEACEIVAGLYRRIHVPALSQLRPLVGYIRAWNADLAELPRSAALPHRLVKQALSLGADLISDPASTGMLIHGDLHYEIAPMLWNRWDELDGDVREGVRRRFSR